MTLTCLHWKCLEEQFGSRALVSSNSTTSRPHPKRTGRAHRTEVPASSLQFLKTNLSFASTLQHVFEHFLNSPSPKCGYDLQHFPHQSKESFILCSHDSKATFVWHLRRDEKKWKRRLNTRLWLQCRCRDKNLKNNIKDPTT